MKGQSIDYACPYCEESKIEAAATAPYVRGFLIAFQYGTKSFVGCTSCVRKKLDQTGIPLDQANIDITQIGYTLATSMMAADGQIDESEVVVATDLGKKVFDDFNEGDFSRVVKSGDLPAAEDLAVLLREVLTDEGKAADVSYL